MKSGLTVDRYGHRDDDDRLDNIIGNAVSANNHVDLPSTAGIHDLIFTTDADEAMRYSLSLPSQTPRDGTQVLALVLHYGGQPAGFYGHPLVQQLIQPALAALNAIMVAPVSLGGDWTSARNEHAVLELFAMIERSYGTDPTRRLITGYSMGGAGTWHMIAQHPDHFSAAVAISGFKPILDSSCKTPIYALMSRADTIFDPVELQGQIDSLAAAGRNAKVDFIDDIDHYNIPAFAPLLERTVPWLQALWGDVR